MLVFRHKVSGGFFSSDDDALSKNKDNPDAELYSRLDELESLRHPSDGKLHFELCYIGEPHGHFNHTLHHMSHKKSE